MPKPTPTKPLAETVREIIVEAYEQGESDCNSYDWGKKIGIDQRKLAIDEFVTAILTAVEAGLGEEKKNLISEPDALVDETDRELIEDQIFIDGYNQRLKDIQARLGLGKGKEK